MINQEVVEEIVKTYDLPTRLEDKISRIATRRINELAISGFDSCYRYIDDLINKFKRPYQERVHISLDSQIKHDSNDTYHDIIGFEDINLRQLFEYEDEPQNRIFASELIDILKDRLSEVELEMLTQLLDSEKNRRLFIYTNPDIILNNVEEIGQRLGSLADKFKFNGGLKIPQRPIIHVNFNPLRIKFGNRKYDGNPLAFFQKNIDTYGKMSRGQLQKFDGGLDVSLRKYGQLDLAIPERKCNNYRLKQEEIDKIISAYSLCDGIRKRAIEITGRSAKAVSKYWKKNGLKATGTGRSLTKVQIKEIHLANELYNGNAAEAARNLPYKRATIYLRWKMAGLRTQTYGEASKLTSAKIKEIKEAKTKFNSMKDAAKHLNYDERTIKKYWNGIPA